MTARGTLYIDEECRDVFENELNGWFGVNVWGLDGNPFGDYWDLSNFPSVVDVNVLDVNRDKIIGKVEITSEFYVEDNYGERDIEISPKSIKLLEPKDDLAELIEEKIRKDKK